MALPEVLDDIDQSIGINCHRLNGVDQCKTILTSHHKFKILTLNIRSLQRNFDAFAVTLKCINVDSVKENYNTFVTEPPIDDANCLSIKISDEIMLLGIYRSPSFTNIDRFVNSMDNTLSQIKPKLHIVLAGDLNIDLLNSSDRNQSQYTCLLSSHGLLPAITKPTRNDSCIDHIFIKYNNTSVGAVCPCSVTDHDIAMAVRTPNKVWKRNGFVEKIYYEQAAKELRSADWSTVTGTSDVNTAAANFDRLISRVIKNNTHTAKISRSKFAIKPWITPGLIRCMRHRDKLHTQVRASPHDPMLRLTYTRYRNFFDNLLYNLKNEYQRNQLSINTNNPLKLWKSIKTICQNPKPKNDADELLNVSGKSKLECLNNCNQFFATNGKKLADSILTNLSETQTSLAAKYKPPRMAANSFYMHPTNVDEVGKIISNLKHDSAPGPDGVKPLLVKEIKDVILEPLTYLCNLSLESGCFPDCWKVASVSPIYKSGPKSSPSNFRPISLLSVFTKILEKLVNIRLSKYIEKNHLISSCQFGFRTGKSTEDAAVLLCDLISGHMDRGVKCVGLFLDLAKAFDTVSGTLLLKKLECIGVRGLALNWFTSYLTGRFQKVKIGNDSSDLLPVLLGVPQGSILGPTLFTLYINDIFDISIPNTELVCYADDTAIIVHGKTWEETYSRAESGLAVVAAWLNGNLLTLNINKTHYVAFSKTLASSPPVDRKIKFHRCLSNPASSPFSSATLCSCQEIARCECFKYLGLLIDQHLSFKQHISSLSARVKKLIYVMKRLRDCATQDVLRLVYLALCQSILQYGVAVWGSAGKSYLIAAERAQRAVIKVMYKKRYRFPTDRLYSETKLLRVRQLFIVKAVTRTHASILNSAGYEEMLRKRNFRAPLPPLRSAMARKSPAFAHPYTYNNICRSLDIKTLSVYRAKKVVLKWLYSLSYHETEKLITKTA
jgi:hypothetical protein